MTAPLLRPFSGPVNGPALDANAIRGNDNRLRDAVTALDDRSLRLVYDARDPRFGAIGDGSANDFTALQDLFDRATDDGAAVYVPPGQYNVSDTLKITGNGLMIFGAGRWRSTLYNATTGATKPTLEIDGSGVSGGISEGITLHDLGFDSSYAGLGHLLVHHTNDWTLDRLYVARVNCQLSAGVYTGAIATHDAYSGRLYAVFLEGNGGHGLKLGDTTNAVDLIGVRSHASVGDGVRLDGNTIAGVGIMGSTIEGNGGYGVHVTGSAAVQALSIGQGTYLEHNHYGTAAGPEILLATPTTGTATTGLVIEGCILDGATVNTYPMRIEAGSGRIGPNYYMRFATANKPQVVAGSGIEGLSVAWPDRGLTRYSNGVNNALGVRAHVNTATGGEEWEYGAGVPSLSEAGFHFYNRTLSSVGLRLQNETWSAASHAVVGIGLNGAAWHSGNGSPEGVVTAPRGDVFLRQDGGAGTTMYVKETGSGTTGWAAK